MSDTTYPETAAAPPRAPRRMLRRIGGTLLAALMLYVLSFGPACFWAVKNFSIWTPPSSNPFPVFTVVYGPLLNLPDGSCRQLIIAYANWWAQKASPNFQFTPPPGRKR